MLHRSVLAHALDLDLTAAASAARRGGFDGLVLDPGVLPALADPSRSAQREIANVLARQGQRLTGVDVRFGPAGLAPPRRGRVGGDVEREVDRVARAIDLARGLGGSLVLCDVGALPPDADEAATPAPGATIDRALLGPLILPDPLPTAPKAPPLPREPDFEQAVDHALREIGARADRAGCLVALRASLGSCASLADALRRAGCAMLGLDLDPVALLADDWSIDALLSRLGPALFHVRGRDALRGAGGRTSPVELGTGHADWPALVSALRELDYRGAITLDTIDLPHRAAAAVRGNRWLGERLAPHAG